MSDLGTLGGSASHARGLNDGGLVVGDANLTGDAATHAFSYSGGSLSDIGTLGGTNSGANAVNGAGEIVGYSDVSGDGASHAFRYAGGSMTDLGTLGGTASLARGINASGAVVGKSQVAGDSDEHGFLYSGGTLYDLNSLIVSAPGHWSVLDAYSINDNGQIAAFGYNWDQDYWHGVLLNPVPEPSSLSVLAVAGLAFLARKRRGKA